MAYNDTLFQLGMDLTRSSPAQKEEVISVTRGAQLESWNGKSEPLSMKTIAIDLYGSTDVSSVRSVQRCFSRALAASKLKIRRVDLKRDLTTGSVTGSATFKGGRATIEAWPATGYVSLDIQTVILPELTLTAFAEAFQAHEVVVKKRRLPHEGARFKKPLSNPARTQAVRKVA